MESTWDARLLSSHVTSQAAIGELRIGSVEVRRTNRTPYDVCEEVQQQMEEELSDPTDEVEMVQVVGGYNVVV